VDPDGAVLESLPLHRLISLGNGME
jgi:hypothetical protein